MTGLLSGGSDRLQQLLERSYAKILEQKAQIERLSADRADSGIAVIGFGCKFPLSAATPEDFWGVLNQGHTAVSEISDDRWSLADHHDAGGRTSGKAYTRAAGLTTDIRAFDARFFGIPAVEAAALDPQQRMLLQVSWHALEHAGLDISRLRGSATGVFVGLTTDDYARIQAQSSLPISTYTGLGSAKSMAAGRLAYFYDFHGPVMQLDTTCSSSLVALHLAARELREGSCDLALVGGANAILSPDTTIGFCEMNALSRSGALRAFDDGADGYVRGEGCGVVVLKRYGDALRDGNTIRGVIAGSAVNHDGRTNGLTAPNPAMQSKVIRAAMAAAGCLVDDIDYVEAHGTGTKLGDLIEVSALAEVYRGRSSPLPIGSVKANVGHLEAAAGMASLIKVLLALQFEVLPRQVNFTKPSTRIDWKRAGIEVRAEPTPWRPSKRLRRAGISAFGMSGTNAHAIICEAPVAAQPEGVPAATMMFVSARSATAMSARLGQFSDASERADDEALKGLAAASQSAHQFDEFRAAVVIDRPCQAARKLRSRKASVSPVPTVEPGLIVYVFTGQGTQWPGMASDLYSTQPAFRDAFDECAEVFQSQTGGNLVDLCCDPSFFEVLERPEHLQPALVAMGVAQRAWWSSLGVHSSGAIGHSIGEYAAAVAVGSLTVHEAMLLACTRGRAVAAAPGGSMFAVVGDAASIACVVANLPSGATIAARNGPGQVVVATDDTYSSAISRLARSSGARAHRLASKFAFHSPMMEEAAIAFRRSAPDVQMRPPTLKWWSTNRQVSHLNPWEDADYWGAQLTRPVEFEAAVEHALSDGARRFIELGPDSALKVTLRTIAASLKIAVTSSSKRAWESHTGEHAIAEWFEAGGEPPQLSKNTSSVRVPCYPFDRVYHWLPLSATPSERNRRTPVPGFELPELRPDQSAKFSICLGQERQPHLAQHVLFGRTVVAGATWIVLALAVAARLYPQRPVTLSRIRFLRPLTLREGREEVVEIEIEPTADGSHRMAVSHGADRLTDAVLGTSAPAPTVLNGDSLGSGIERANLLTFYREFERRGYQLGPAFRWMTSGVDYANLWRRQLTPPQLPADGNAYPLFPGLVDSSFHALSEVLGGKVDLLDGEQLVVPTEIDQVHFYPPQEHSQTWSVDAMRPTAEDVSSRLEGNLLLSSASGSTVLDVRCISFRKIDRSSLIAVAAQPQTHLAAWSGDEQPAPLEPLILQASIEVGPAADCDESVPGSARIFVPVAELLASPSQTSIRLDGVLTRLPRLSNVRLSVVETAQTKSAVVDLAEACFAWSRLLGALGASRHVEAPVYVVALRSDNASATGPESAALAPLFRSAAAEHPALRIQILVAPASHASFGPRDVAGVAIPGEFHWTGTGWREPKLVHAMSETATMPSLEGGVVLVTGGSSALSTTVVDWLTGFNPREIWLASRGIRDPTDLQPSGAVVRVKCDVTDSKSVQTLFGDIAAQGKKVVAVVHLAGALADHALSNVSAADFRVALSPKLGGLVTLAEHWDRRHLQWVLSVSSLASLTGSAGQAAYAVANRALDDWTKRARDKGTRACVLHLGPVDVGMGGRLSHMHTQRLGRMGVGLLRSSEVGEGLSQALLSASGERAFYAASSPAQPTTDLRSSLTSRDETPGDILTDLCVALATLTGSGRPTEDPDATMAQLGADSLLAAELSVWIRDRFAVDMSMDTVLAQPSLRTLATHIEANMLLPSPPVGLADQRNVWSEGEL